MKENINMFTSRTFWKSFKDFNKIFKPNGGPFTQPFDLNQIFHDDFFVYQRLAGCNPFMIKLFSEFPSKN